MAKRGLQKIGAKVLKVIKQLKEAGINNYHSPSIIFQAKNSTFNPDTWEPEKMLHMPLDIDFFTLTPNPSPIKGEGGNKL